MILQWHKTFSAVEKIIIIICISITIAAVIVPLIMAILWSLVSPDVAWSYPDLLPSKMNLGRWVYLWKFTAIKGAIINSYTIAPVVSLLSLILSFPTAYALGRYEFKGKMITQIITLLPLLLPGLAVAIFFTQMLNYAGIRSEYLGIVIGHTIRSLPYSIRLLSSAFYNIPQDQINAARDLGANKAKVFITAYMPVIRPTAFVTFVYVFIKSVEEFNLSFIIGAPSFTTVPTILFSFLGFNFVRPNAAVVSLILLVPNLIVMFSIEKALNAQKIIGSGVKG